MPSFNLSVHHQGMFQLQIAISLLICSADSLFCKMHNKINLNSVYHLKSPKRWMVLLKPFNNGPLDTFYRNIMCVPPYHPIPRCKYVMPSISTCLTTWCCWNMWLDIGNWLNCHTRPWGHYTYLTDSNLERIFMIIILLRFTCVLPM